MLLTRNKKMQQAERRKKLENDCKGPKKLLVKRNFIPEEKIPVITDKNSLINV
jgi:hypothetical protein